MTPYTVGTRWWENYLVRYFMPSIAGAVAVSWLVSVAGAEFRDLLRLPDVSKDLTSSSLLLLFLYGNLFCYVASYPILTFHATRVLDFAGRDIRWQWAPPNLDGYLATGVLAVGVLLVSLFTSHAVMYAFAFIAAATFSGVQLVRLRSALARRKPLDGLDADASPMFGLAYSLARRRALRQETKLDHQAVLGSDSEKSEASKAESSASNKKSSSDDDESSSRSVSRVIEWRVEFMETYRHMREHGNSAFIFVLELVLAGLSYCVLSWPGLSGSGQLTAIGVLFGIWAIPAVFVHLAGQQLERRFSRLDSR